MYICKNITPPVLKKKGLCFLNQMRQANSIIGWCRQHPHSDLGPEPDADTFTDTDTATDTDTNPNCSPTRTLNLVYALH